MIDSFVEVSLGPVTETQPFQLGTIHSDWLSFNLENIQRKFFLLPCFHDFCHLMSMSQHFNLARQNCCKSSDLEQWVCKLKSVFLSFQQHFDCLICHHLHLVVPG